MPVLSSEGNIARQVAEHYRQLIKSGRSRPGERLPTNRELSKRLGVGLGTVHQAFATLGQEGLIYRRKRLGTFVGRSPIEIPAALDVGVLFRMPREWGADDNYGLQMFQGIQEALQSGGHQITLVTFASEDGFSGRTDEVPRQFTGRPMHGYIVDERVPDALIARLADGGRTVIVVNRGCKLAGVGAAFRDNRQAGVEAAGRLLAAGHRVAGCVLRDDWNGHAAAEAFLAAMTAARAAVPAARVVVFDGRCPDPPAFRILMSAVPVPTAIFATDAYVAKYMVKMAMKSGLRVPRDLAVVGALDLEFASRTEPPLTTMRFEPEAIGRAAVEELVACCREPGRSPRQQAIAGQWVERGSMVSVQDA